MEPVLAGESKPDTTDSDLLRTPSALLNEKPTNGRSLPEKPAGFSWHGADSTRTLFSGSSKLEVSSSDLRVGTKGGGAQCENGVGWPQQSAGGQAPEAAHLSWPLGLAPEPQTGTGANTKQQRPRQAPNRRALHTG